MPEENNLSNLKTLVVSISRSDCSLQEANANVNGLSTNINQVLISTSNLRQIHPLSNAKINEDSITNKSKASKKKWKLAHQQKINASERERKGRLAANIKKLKEVIPLEAIKLQTKESVLEEALKYISKLKAQVEQMLLKDAPDNLVVEMENLRKKIDKLETEKKSYLRILQSHGLLNKSQVNKVPIPKLQNSKKQIQLIESASTSTTVTSHSEVHQKTSQSNSPRSSVEITSDCVCSKASSTCSVASSCSLPSFVECSASSAGSDLTAFSSKSDTISLPKFDLLFQHPNTACCSPTYSMARMKSDNRSKAPTLCTILTETSRKKKQNSSTSRTEPYVIRTSPTNSLPSLVQTVSLPSLTSSNLVMTTKPNFQRDSVRVSSQFTSESFSNSSTASTTSSLLSWLRSGHSQTSCTSNTPTVIVTNSTSNIPSTIQIVERSNASVAFKNANASMVSKKESHSFNIASLMKSKEALPENRSVAYTVQSPSLPNRSSKDLQVSSAIGNADFHTATPKDVFQQSFDNDILECLQNIRGLATPEPPGKNTSNSVPLGNPEWSNYSYSTGASRVIVDVQPRSSVTIAQIASSSRSYPTPHRAVISDESQYSLRCRQLLTSDSFAKCQYDGAASASVSKSRTGSDTPRSTSFSTATYLNYVTSTTSVLWQPAITNASVRHGASNLPGCFSPISYFTNNGFHISQNSSSNNPVWAASSQNTFASGPSRTASETPQNVSDFEHPKKRKLHQAGPSKTTVSKRKKSTNKPQEQDTHSISRLIGNQYNATSTHLPMCEPTQRLRSHGPSLSYEVERNTSHSRTQIFVNSSGGGLVPPGMAYNNYPPQPNLFHSTPTMNPERAPYHHPPSGYFYNHPVGSHSQQPPGSMYVPQFANINNNNSASSRHHKGSQHHIRQILS